MSTQHAITVTYLMVSLVSLGIQTLAWSRLRRGHRLDGLLRTSASRVFCSVLYVLVGTNALEVDFAVLQVTFGVFCVTQIVWWGNAALDVMLGRPRYQPEHRPPRVARVFAPRVSTLQDMALVCPDVSEFQPVVTAAYNRRVLIMRVAFGAHYQDQHFLANASAAKRLHDRGHIDGVILYTVYLSSATPQEQYAYCWKLIGPSAPTWLLGIMIDVEHWGGTSYPVNGNHSAQLNTLYGLHAHKMGGWNGCIGYGNRGDLATLWPQRDARCHVIEAKYGRDVSLDVRGAIGVQYSDGQSKWGVPTGLPISTPPFGHCDHNVFPKFANGAALRAFMRPTSVVAPAKPAAAAPHYPAPQTGGHNAIIGKARAYAYFATDDGRIEVRHNGTHVGYIKVNG